MRLAVGVLLGQAAGGPEGGDGGVEVHGSPVPGNPAGTAPPQVQSDVDDHADGAQRLARQEPEPGVRRAEPAELVHQPLGVERPALAVGRLESEAMGTGSNT